MVLLPEAPQARDRDAADVVDLTDARQSVDVVDITDGALAPAAPPRHRAVERLRRNRTAGVVSAGLSTVVVAVVHAVGVLGYPALGDDEGTYAAQAWAVRHGELAHYTYWYDHPPLGWLQLAAVDWLPQLLLPSVSPVAASRLVLVVVAAASGLLAWMLAYRIGLGAVFSALAVLLGFCSPLALTLQRQVYLDNLAVPWVLLAFVLVLDRRQRLWFTVAGGAAFGVAVLTKETTAVLLPLLVWAAYRAGSVRNRVFCLVGACAGALLVILYYPLLALLRNEFWPGPGHVSLVDALLFQTVRRTGSGAVWEPGSAGNAVLASWLYYDPWLIALGLAGMALCLTVRRTRVVAVLLLVVVLVALKPGGYLPAMYVTVALPLFGIAAAAAAHLLWKRSAGLLSRLPAPGDIVQFVPSALVGTAVALLAVAWFPGVVSAMTTDANDARTAAETWTTRNVPGEAVVLTDDVSWLTLVQRGVLRREHTIWFYKLDTDPAVRAQFPRGWRDVDYVVATPELRQAVAGDPGLAATAQALARSQVVASFGGGDSRVEVRRVTGILAPASSSAPTSGSPAGSTSGAAPSTSVPAQVLPSPAPTPGPQVVPWARIAPVPFTPPAATSASATTRSVPTKDTTTTTTPSRSAPSKGTSTRSTPSKSTPSKSTTTQSTTGTSTTGTWAKSTTVQAGGRS